MNILANIGLQWRADNSPHPVENPGMDFKIGEAGANYKNVQQSLVSSSGQCAETTVGTVLVFNETGELLCISLYQKLTRH